MEIGIRFPVPLERMAAVMPGYTANRAVNAVPAVCAAPPASAPPTTSPRSWPASADCRRPRRLLPLSTRQQDCYEVWPLLRLSCISWTGLTVPDLRPHDTGRPYALPESLDLLQGPSTGTVRLPTHLDWSGDAVYDLDAPGRVVDLYRVVLIEAANPQDLYSYLDAGLLRRLWALLWLPAQLRWAWEQKFPVLAEIRRLTAAV